MKLLRARTRRKNKTPIPFKHIIPNMVTSGNLLCGMFSMMLATQGRFVPASWLIFCAVIFDGLDGKVARVLGGGSQFGLEFDSLADLVSFGVAPAMMMYLASLQGLIGAFGGGVFASVMTCFFALCVALRLARFNVVHVPGPFQGLPAPAGGLFMASWVLADLSLAPIFVAPLMAVVGMLMISSVPYANLKKLTKDRADRKKCAVFLAFVSICFTVLKSAAPFVLFLLYIVSGLIRFDWGEWLLLPEDPLEEHVH